LFEVTTTKNGVITNTTVLYLLLAYMHIAFRTLLLFAKWEKHIVFLKKNKK